MHDESTAGDVRTEALRWLRTMVAARRALVARVRRGAGVLRAHALFHGAELGWRVNATGHLEITAEGRIAVGDYVDFVGGMIPSRIACRRGGELVVGEHCKFNYGAVIDCSRRIQVGRRCMFGSMVRLRDASATKSGEIVIEDDVWVAHGASIEPGVRIGAGSAVSAGSVVTSDVPPDSLAVGDPAESFPLGGEVRSSGSAGAAW